MYSGIKNFYPRLNALTSVLLEFYVLNIESSSDVRKSVK